MKQPYFDTTILTKRITAISGTDNQDWQTNLTGVSCNIQPLDGNYNEDLEGSYGRDYLMFCNIVDIIEGDKIIDGTDEYLVKSVKDYSVMNFSIKELIIRKTQ
jgi:hypothetical protein